MEDLAQYNKRKWGYGYYFEPTLKNSRKRKLYNELGGNFIAFYRLRIDI